MCGIVGYIGKEPCVQLIFNGLKKLEYRGYDSSGIAVHDTSAIRVIKNDGKLDRLEPMLQSLPQSASVGMGHTRWATHGLPTQRNAHPHMQQGTAIIHNGILENFQDLKIELLEMGTVFQSDTDSEIILHLLKNEFDVVDDMKMATLNIINRLTGAYALGIMSVKDPEAIYVVKQGTPMVIGLGKAANYFASDALALLEHTDQIIFLEDGEIARVARTGITIWNFFGAEVKREAKTLEYSTSLAEKGGYRHYMLKEIHEQASVTANTIQRLTQISDLAFAEEELGLKALDMNQVQSITITGCGTAFHSGLIGRYVIESVLRIPVQVELASELRYRNPVLNKNTLLIALTQSGETADTLACVKMARELGSQVLTICNVKYSSIPRAATATIYMNNGPEIGVASTKAFTSMVLNLYIFTLALGKQRKALTPDNIRTAFQYLRELPNLVDQALTSEALIEDLASKYAEETNCLFIGRGAGFPIALEGALKLKEVSYIHAEGYAGGELKHGPIAIIDKKMPIVACIPMIQPHRDKMLSNVQEVCAREGKVLGIGAKDDDEFRALCEHYIPSPQIADETLQAILTVIPLQFFAYYVALRRGTDVDQPRNLAKSVTVE